MMQNHPDTVGFPVHDKVKGLSQNPQQGPSIPRPPLHGGHHWGPRTCQEAPPSTPQHVVFPWTLPHHCSPPSRPERKPAFRAKLKSHWTWKRQFPSSFRNKNINFNVMYTEITDYPVLANFQFFLSTAILWRRSQVGHSLKSTKDIRKEHRLAGS